MKTMVYDGLKETNGLQELQIYCVVDKIYLVLSFLLQNLELFNAIKLLSVI